MVPVEPMVPVDRVPVVPVTVVPVEPPMVDPPVPWCRPPVEPVTVAAVEPPVVVAPSEPVTVPVEPPVFVDPVPVVVMLVSVAPVLLDSPVEALVFGRAGAARLTGGGAGVGRAGAARPPSWSRPRCRWSRELVSRSTWRRWCRSSRSTWRRWCRSTRRSSRWCRSTRRWRRWCRSTRWCEALAVGRAAGALVEALVSVDPLVSVDALVSVDGRGSVEPLALVDPLVDVLVSTEALCGGAARRPPVEVLVSTEAPAEPLVPLDVLVSTEAPAEPPVPLDGADVDRGAGRAAGVDRSDRTARHRARVQGLGDTGKDAAEQTGSGEHGQAQENPSPQALSAAASQKPAIAERSTRILHPDLQERSGLVPALSIACTQPGDAKTRSLRVEKNRKSRLEQWVKPTRTHTPGSRPASVAERQNVAARAPPQPPR